MKVKSNAILCDPWGQPLQISSSKGGEMVDATLGEVCIQALLRGHPEDQTLEMKESLRRHALAVAFAQSEYVEIDVQDAALLQRLIHRTVTRAFFAPAYQLLEGEGHRAV
ncbi:hypothetical protein V5F79_17545 [Xanthobacter flavus]|uniref:hypothetical protein n=1 Tax=Xanthobacter flavus TaxID=281 RepID=UPI0037271731